MNQARDDVVSLKIGESEVDLLGTAHISKVSRNRVAELLTSGAYDAVAVEVCERRHQAIVNPAAVSKMDLWQVLKEKKTLAMTAMLALAAYQQRLADQLGIEVGADMKAAIRLADEKSLALTLIDRDIGTTLRRLYHHVVWWKRSMLIVGMLSGMLRREKISEAEVEELKRGDMIETMLNELDLADNPTHKVLIAERDLYMAANITDYAEKHRPAKMLVVIGAGHLPGIIALLQEGVANAREKIVLLDEMPPAPIWPKMLPWMIVAIIIAGFMVGFNHSTDLGFGLVLDWILINGGLAAIGAFIAGGHFLTIITAFLAAPLTSINPTIGAGMVTAAAELYIRKPRVMDFETLRRDTSRLAGWRHNRVARTLLVFVLSTIGSAIGTYLGGIHIYRSVF